MKYRSRAGKVKYEHSMIKGLREYLESIQKNPEIQSMIPGEIKPVKKPSPFKIRRVTPTGSGLKAIFHSGGAVQEVFFVGDIDKLTQILQPMIMKDE